MALHDHIKEFRNGFRLLLRNRGFALAAFLILSLGIGANATIFAVVYNVLLRPLPLHDAEDLVMIWGDNEGEGIEDAQISPLDMEDWIDQGSFFESIVAFRPKTYNLKEGGEPERILGNRVSEGFFPLLGVRPPLGRFFAPEEFEAGADDVVVLSHGLWHRRFGADRDILGRSVDLSGETKTVIGVAPEGMRFLRLLVGVDNDVDLWTPLPEDPQATRNQRWVFAIGRLSDGVDVQTAQVEMDAISRRLEQAYPDTNTGWRARLEPVREMVSGDIQTSLLILFGTVGFVLLIACANVANLLLARALARSSEVAVRSALGASRWRLTRQMLSEGLALALLGAVGGLLMTYFLLRLLRWLQPEEIPLLERLAIGPPVLLFTLLLAVVTTLLFSLVPSLQMSRTNLAGTLREDGRVSEGRSRRRIRRGLVAAEVALALVLLAGAGLMVRTFQSLNDVDLGFRPEGVVALKTIPGYEYQEDHRVHSYINEVLRRVRALPGVESAGEVNFLPFSGHDAQTAMEIRGRAPEGAGVEYLFHFRAASPDYFETMGIDLLEGRTFRQGDLDNPYVAIVNETAAREFWPSGSPLGGQFHYILDQPWLTVVGVVEDARHERPDEPPLPEIYLPYTMDLFSTRIFVVRGSIDEQTLARQARQAMQKVEPNLPIFDVYPMEDLVAQSLTRERFLMVMLLALAFVALALAALGIYGLISYSMARRRHEIGIRMAFGARLSDVYPMLLRQEGVMIVTGVAVGVAAALFVTQILESLLFGVDARDPWSLVIGSLTLILAAFLAISVAVLRARFDPMVALREG